ncbi:glycosyltransferase family 2 protein [Vibrio sp. 1180_3]|uniref:glycosyltransferase family 2 protein n=1 Tax=Vibrio sp. 1180_3 TaxID=2528832 RepID=UPI00240502E3|nr:glycosyltransferase family 2 protein [Vibrio sp. 1180_3]MDF9401269.1 glycosyltransferase family 2 protein [Vibrio sp. 1180_3]
MSNTTTLNPVQPCETLSALKKLKVSVIVPVYNTEQYVERAIVSLMEQTLDDVEIIIIDDGSKDNSLAIIEQVIARYPARQKLIKLVSRENRGVAKTRAQGMKLANGEYVIHLDSDDWVELNWLESMYRKAIEDNADIVVCDYTSVFKMKNVQVHMPAEKTGEECLRQLLNDRQRGFTVNKLVSRKIINEVGDVFIEGVNFLEDYIYIAKCFKASNLVSYIPFCLYNYNQENINSLTKGRSESKKRDALEAVGYISRIIPCNEMTDDFMRFKIKIKSYLIYCEWDDVSKETWQLYLETNPYILRSEIPVQIKIGMLLANLSCYSLATIWVKCFFSVKFFIKRIMPVNLCNRPI